MPAARQQLVVRALLGDVAVVDDDDARRALTVDRRWAITIDVRPRMSSAMPRSMTRSVSGSTLAVASSSTRISGSRARARAKATSWRSPEE